MDARKVACKWLTIFTYLRGDTNSSVIDFSLSIAEFTVQISYALASLSRISRFSEHTVRGQLVASPGKVGGTSSEILPHPNVDEFGRASCVVSCCSTSVSYGLASIWSAAPFLSRSTFCTVERVFFSIFFLAAVWQKNGSSCWDDQFCLARQLWSLMGTDFLAA